MAKSKNKEDDQQKDNKIIPPLNMPFEDALKKALNTPLPATEKNISKKENKKKN
jgi:hypothetical protein